jgi:hypothetical protein
MKHEAKEELCIDVKAKDLEFNSVINKYIGDE